MDYDSLTKSTWFDTLNPSKSLGWFRRIKSVKIHAKPHVLDAYASLYPEILKWTKKQNF